MAILREASVRDPLTRPAGIELGSFAPLEPERQARTKLILATYNIRYAVGSFLITGSLLRRLGLGRPHRRPRLIQKHIRRAATALTDGERLPRIDVLALQEADKQTLRAGGIHVARELAREMRMAYAYAPFDLPRGEEPKAKQWYLDFEEHMTADETGETGLATLSCLPLHSVERLELPWSECRWRPRLALETVVRVNAKPVHLYNAHIDPHGEIDARLRQVQAILERADETGAATVLFGDFNTLTAEARQRMRAAVEARGFETPFRDGMVTWRAGLVRLHTDWIFVRGARVTRAGVARGLGVSDHWPVWAEIDFGGE